MRTSIFCPTVKTKNMASQQNLVKMNKCPNESCGEYGQGKFCSNCGTKCIPDTKSCSGTMEDGSKCQEQIEVAETFCVSCQKKIQEAVKTIKDKVQTTGSYKEEMDTGFLESLPTEPGRTKEEINRFRGVAKQRGAAALIEYVETQNNAWKDVPLNIGVTGLSGVGKSSFINKIRGVKNGQAGFAPVGKKETTVSLTRYPHPDNPSLIFWDMPGVGTPSFPKDNYLEAVKFHQYDFFLILSQKRFRDEDAWLANEAQKSGKSCFFVRTHIHDDVCNDKEDNPENYSKEKVLEEVREDCRNQLNAAKLRSVEIYLIDNHKMDDYDFEKLTLRLIKSGFADEQKRIAFILSLSILTNDVIEEKRKILEARIWIVALASAVAGAVPVPVLGICVDTVLMVREFNEYRRQLGLNDELLQNALRSNIATDLLKKYGIYCAEMTAVLAADEALESAFKFGIPILGMIASGALSYYFTAGALKKLLNELVKDAQKMIEETKNEQLRAFSVE